MPKPWSDDPIFQRTYFCNVHRENDKVTKWIREYYTPYAQHPMFEYNIVLSRFLNFTPTLDAIGYQYMHDPLGLIDNLNMLAAAGKIWGNAYVITTHGIKMDKITYLVRNVLDPIGRSIEEFRAGCRGSSLYATAEHLQRYEGIGSFLAGQIAADLKNTPHHAMSHATDWWTFASPGPGSLRGLSWFFTGTPDKLPKSDFTKNLAIVREVVDAHMSDVVPKFCNQDLQNCLCEYDKYMRVKNGTGRSKRNYYGY